MYYNNGAGPGAPANGGRPLYGGGAPPAVMYVQIDGDKIVQFGVNNGQVLGYTAKAYEEAVKLAEDYEKVLVEHGLLEKEKTQEETMKELSDNVGRILSMVEDVSGRVAALERSEARPPARKAADK